MTDLKRSLGRFLTVAGSAGIFGTLLWADQGELAVAAVLLVGGLGLFVVRAQLDGLVDIVSPLLRAGAVSLKQSRAVARYRSDMRAVRGVAVAALVGLSIVGLQLAPVVLFNSGTHDAGIASAETDATYTGDKINVSNADPAPEGVTITPGGSHMILTGDEYDKIYKYDLSTDGEISTGTLSQTYDSSSEDGSGQDIEFGPDGLRMYYVGGLNGDIHQYSLSDPYNISSATLEQSVDIQPDTVISVDLIEEGNTLVVMDYNDIIFHYDLSSPYDVSTATKGGEKQLQSRSYDGMQINSDGSYFWGLTDGKVYEYELSTPGDVTTASEVRMINATSESDYTSNMGMSADGSNTYIVDTRDPVVREYDIDTSGFSAGGEPLSSTVTDADGDPIDGASVKAINSSTGETADSGTTDSSGNVELSVDPGTYDVEVTASDKETKTTTVDVPEGGTSVEFSLRDAPGSYTIVDADGTEVTDHETRIELYEASPESITKEARYWLDETDKSPIATGSGSSISLDAADYDGYYVVAWRSEDTGSPQYRDLAIPVTNITGDYDVVLTGNATVQQRVAIDDRTGNWSSENVIIRADQLDGDTASRAALGSKNLGTLWLNDSTTYNVYAQRDDGAERFLGRTDIVRETSDNPVVFTIREPADEFNESDIQNKTDSEVKPWDNESDIHYPPTAVIDADNRSPVAGDSVTFDASGSTAYGDASIASYSWELPDGSTAAGSSASWSSSSDDAGTTVTATVTVKDSEGVQDTAQVTLYIAEDAADAAVPPTADATLETDDPVAGEPVVLAEAADTANGVALESVEWDVDGDGKFDEAGEKLEYQPEQSGLETVTIRVTDANGVSASRSISFFVGSDANSGLGFGGGGGGGVGGGPIGGGGDGPSGSQQIALGVAGVGGYALWRRSGGPGVVALGRRAAPAVKRAGSGALSAVGALARGTGRAVRKLVGALT